MEARTVGDLKKILENFSDDMPLWMTASCYTHDGKVFTQIRPYKLMLEERRKLDDRSEEIMCRGIGILVNEEEREYRTVKRNGKYKREYRKYLRITNSNSDEFETDEE